MSIVLAAYLVRLVVGYQVPTAVQFANAPAWLTRPLVLISSAHEDAEPRAFQRRLEDAGFRVRIDEGAPRAGDSLIAAIATAILELERSIPVWV
jgi:hypothetical protein